MKKLLVCWIVFLFSFTGSAFAAKNDSVSAYNISSKLIAGDYFFDSGKAVNTLNSTYYAMSTGAHYVVTSREGYNGASGNITLPSVKMAVPGDTAFEIFGVYSHTAGMDLGIWCKDNQNWYIGATVSDPNGNITWYRSYSPISKAQHPTVHMIVKVQDDAVLLEVYDGRNYKIIDSRIINAPNCGFNAAGTGIKLTREHALAFISKKGDLSDGSYMLDSKWSNVYIYSKNGFSLWTSDFSASRLKGDTSDEQQTIHLSDLIPDYQDTCSILYNLP